MANVHIGKLSKEISTTVTDEFSELLTDRTGVRVFKNGFD